jgi:TonB family protein
MLVTEMLSRSTQSLEAQDTAAAKTWIDSAARLAADPERIEQARDALTQYLVEAQTHKLLPASELTQTRYVAPEYPPFALNRGVEGWVEIEFVVSPEGETEDLSVVDALNDQYFREPAVGAVSQWRFEPIHFMGRAIPQHAYTRVAFVLK